MVLGEPLRHSFSISGQPLERSTDRLQGLLDGAVAGRVRMFLEERFYFRSLFFPIFVFNKNKKATTRKS